jgi:tRNA pseudouridine38-40 synthase
MIRAARTLVGTHDFASFQTSGSERETTVRTVFAIDIERRLPVLAANNSSASAIHIEIEADGFLYNMVRNIVGTLYEVGRGVQPESWVAEVLAAKDRRRAGQTAPAQGLCLLRVDYPSVEASARRVTQDER